MLKHDRILDALSALGHGAPAAREETPREEAAPSRPPIKEILRGDWIETERGPAFVKESTFPLGHRHGRFPLGKPLDAAQEALGVTLGQPRPPHPSRLAFLDIETTGLAGGTGTYAFLVGLGSFEEGAFRVRQYFLPAIDEEPPMLEILARDLSRLEGLVTYNGRAFDVPILEARMTLARMRWPCDRMPHFDLLRAVRRLYRHRLEGCRLADAEEHLLGIRRADDVPGYLIPSLYFDYIRAGRAAPLRAVFRHNAEDVLSMVGILAFLTDLFSRRDLDPEDAVSVARWWEIEEAPDRAEFFYRQVLERLDDGQVWSWAASRYALLRKRAGARREVVEIWRRLWSSGDLEAGVEIAKYLEHEARDIEAALEIAAALLRDAPQIARPALEHRLRRLRRKIERR